PLKPGLFGRKRHELDSPNLGGHLPRHPTPWYNLSLRCTEMGCGAQGELDPLSRLSPKRSEDSPPLKRGQPPQTSLLRCVDHEVHLQWIPSHVDIYGNEVADNLAKQGTAEPLCSTPSLTFDEIYSIRKNKDLKTWRVPPSHDWYKRSSPGGSIGLACDRADQTALSRFVSGHLRSCSFSHGNKVFPVCAKCGVASEHILSCLRLSRETFETDPLLALDFSRVSGLMDGV
ncbi:hypothetical protein AVEN_56735-1, partial [Araneus ventricosus]